MRAELIFLIPCLIICLICLIPCLIIAISVQSQRMFCFSKPPAAAACYPLPVTATALLTTASATPCRTTPSASLPIWRLNSHPSR